MNGIFVAYHNTGRLLGFEYISKEEMDKYIYGNSIMGDKYFDLISRTTEYIANFFTTKFPNKIVRLSYQAHKGHEMTIYAQELDSLSPWSSVPRGKFHCFKVKASVYLNQKQVYQILHMDESDQLDVKLSIENFKNRGSDEVSYMRMLRSMN